MKYLCSIFVGVDATQMRRCMFFWHKRSLFPNFSCSWKKSVSFVLPILHIHKFSRVMHCCTYITTPAGLQALLLLRGFNPGCHLWWRRCFCKWRYFHHTIKHYWYIIFFLKKCYILCINLGRVSVELAQMSFSCSAMRLIILIQFSCCSRLFKVTTTKLCIQLHPQADLFTSPVEDLTFINGAISSLIFLLQNNMYQLFLFNFIARLLYWSYGDTFRWGFLSLK